MKADVSHVRTLLEDPAIEWDIADLALIELLARERRQCEQAKLIQRAGADLIRATRCG